MQSTNFKEMDALLLAAEHLETDAQQQHSAVKFSDSLSALEAIQSNPMNNTSATLCEQLNKLSKKSKTVLQWIPSHSVITGNENADQLAKGGSKLPQPPSTVSYEESKTLLKNTGTQE